MMYTNNSIDRLARELFFSFFSILLVSYIMFQPSRYKISSSLGYEWAVFILLFPILLLFLDFLFFPFSSELKIIIKFPIYFIYTILFFRLLLVDHFGLDCVVNFYGFFSLEKYWSADEMINWTYIWKASRYDDALNIGKLLYYPKGLELDELIYRSHGSLLEFKDLYLTRCRDISIVQFYFYETVASFCSSALLFIGWVYAAKLYYTSDFFKGFFKGGEWPPFPWLNLKVMVKMKFNFFRYSFLLWRYENIYFPIFRKFSISERKVFLFLDFFNFVAYGENWRDRFQPGFKNPHRPIFFRILFSICFLFFFAYPLAQLLFPYKGNGFLFEAPFFIYFLISFIVVCFIFISFRIVISDKFNKVGKIKSLTFYYPFFNDKLVWEIARSIASISVVITFFVVLLSLDMGWDRRRFHRHWRRPMSRPNVSSDLFYLYIFLNHLPFEYTQIYDVERYESSNIDRWDGQVLTDMFRDFYEFEENPESNPYFMHNMYILGDYAVSFHNRPEDDRVFYFAMVEVKSNAPELLFWNGGVEYAGRMQRDVDDDSISDQVDSYYYDPLVEGGDDEEEPSWLERDAWASEGFKEEFKSTTHYRLLEEFQRPPMWMIYKQAERKKFNLENNVYYFGKPQTIIFNPEPKLPLSKSRLKLLWNNWVLKYESERGFYPGEHQGYKEVSVYHVEQGLLELPPKKNKLWKRLYHLLVV